MNKNLPSIFCAAGRVVSLFLLLAIGTPSGHGEAMLELFNVPWAQLTQKMPEIAEAGYDSLWLPNPAKGTSGAYSYGYDLFDPFDLGSTNQQGTVATRWGTESQLITMVQTAHRFGIRIYFDNVMNHRSSTVPGYPGSGTATNYYPGLIPQDFHLQSVTGGYKNWDSVSDWCTTENVQNNPLLGLCDIANEPGALNWNFGPNYGNTLTKPSFVRFPGRTDLYMDTNGAFLGAGTNTAGWSKSPSGYTPLNGWRPFDGQGQPVAEDASTYLCRAAAWTLWTTKCDGFRLDAVKHVPAPFFGSESGQTDDPAFAGYTGAIQAMYDYTHGYGNNVTTNGYVETDGNRNSLFNTETTRNDAMIFGEYIPSALPLGNDFYDYLNSGMRLLNQPLYNQMNSILSGSTMAGMDSRDYTPACSGCNCDGNGNYSMAQAVNMPQTQDSGTCCPDNEGLEDAYFFMHEGLPMVYSDGFNHNTSGGTPIESFANYLGEFGDNSMPDVMYLHNQLARGGTNPRWSDQYTACFERYDYREGTNTEPQNQVCVLVGLNDNTGDPGDETFDDGVSRTSDGYYGGISVSNSKGQGLVVGFPPGSVLVQLASSSPTGGRAYKKLLVHGATSSSSTAASTANATDPTQRLIYVGNETIPTGGGAIEFNLPDDSWVMYGYQWPQASQANVSTNAVIFRQGGNEVQHITVNRTDGVNGDTAYNPLFPFKMRGSVDQYGNVIGGIHVSNLTYAIDIPIVTNANFDIVARSDASCVNTLFKMDGGIDLNSQMGLGPTNATGLAPTNFLDLRDNPPGYADDVFLGYEHSAYQFRNGPEKFAAHNIASNNIVSLGAETYYYTVGGTTNIVSGSGYGVGITNQTADWVFHDPAATNSASGNGTATQRMPFMPASGQSATIYVKVGYRFEINTCFIYYTTDGSNPEGAFGTGKGTTQVVQGHWVSGDSSDVTIDWWTATIPAQANGVQVRYKVALFYGGSAGNTSIGTISDAEPQGSKLFGLSQFAITNFNPNTAVVWLHNDLNPANTVTGLQSGFHIVRARTFLPRSGKSSVYNTFLQTFYYDGALPTGVIAYPTSDGTTLGGSTYTVVVRCDSTVTGVNFNIQDGNSSFNDAGVAWGNGNSNGVPVYVAATQVTPDSTLSAEYPNYPQEFRFVYTNVPTSGTGTINVQLNEFSTSVYPNRFTTLTRAVNTLAPTEVVEFSTPATNGVMLPYTTNMTYVLQGCFSTALTSAAANFNLLINGVLQPSGSYILRGVGSLGPIVCPGLKSFTYNWVNPQPGTNLIQLIYTNAVEPISDVRTLTIVPPLHITGLVNNNQLVVWQSAAGVNYQVYATTNLMQPFTPISDPIPGTGSTTFFYDPYPQTNAMTQKYYEIQLAP